MTAKKPFTIADAEKAIARLRAELEVETKPAKQKLLRQRISKVRTTEILLSESKLQSVLKPKKFQKKLIKI